MVQTEAKIYLSEQRGCTQTEAFRSFHTFNFGSFFQESKKNWGVLQTINEETLVGNGCIEQAIEAQTTVVLLPIVGTIDVANGYNTEGSYAGVGEAYFFTTVDEDWLRVSNPYEREEVSYLQIRLQNADCQPYNNETITNFAFEKYKNRLLPYCPQKEKQTVWGSIGQFDGRAESVYCLKNPQNNVFVYVIEGVFEVQNRLLHARDGLALWHLETVELEALSNDAVILLIEMAQPFSS
ncbi:MAG: hypothetical protein JNL70_22315 [Saprospiraceae bacterium]|nr:hypothetical protein [Saprospiraceae bacterium]